MLADARPLTLFALAPKFVVLANGRAAAVFTLTLLALVLADASATLSQTPSSCRLLYAIVVSSVALFGHATGQCWPAGNGRQRVRCAGVTAGMAIWLGARNVK